MVFIWFMVAGATACRAATNWDTPATELANKIAALAGPGAISLSIRNSSSISSDEVPAIRKVLIAGLSKQGITVRADGQAATSVRVTLSQNARQGVWVAEVQQGPEVRIAMVTVANSAPAAAAKASEIVLRKTLLFSQGGPILDAEMIERAGVTAAARLVVLSAEQIAVYRRDGGADAPWISEQRITITHDRPYPRDLRGRLQMDGTGLFKAYLPGVVCGAPQAGAASDAMALSCVDSDDPWPIGTRKAFYNGSRDYFTGVMVPAQSADPRAFFSAAELAQKGRTAMVYSQIDGQFALADGGALKALAGARDWGSDVAGVQSGCGSGAQLLATSAGDGVQDTLRAYDVVGREAIPASSPLTLDGHVTALWPVQAAGNAPSEAVVILEKQQPRTYEAYRVSVVCNQ